MSFHFQVTIFHFQSVIFHVQSLSLLKAIGDELLLSSDNLSIFHCQSIILHAQTKTFPSILEVLLKTISFSLSTVD